MIDPAMPNKSFARDLLAFLPLSRDHLLVTSVKPDSEFLHDLRT